MDAGWSEEESVVITCDGTEVVMEDSGVEETGNAAAESGIIRITAAGTYILRGTYNGQIQVDAGKDDLVRLVMDGFNISNERYISYIWETEWEDCADSGGRYREYRDRRNRVCV